MSKIRDLKRKVLCGDVDAEYELGVCYRDGIEVERNLEDSFYYFQLAASQGHADSQYMIGVCYDEGQGVEQNDIMALRYYKMAAKKGHIDAQYHAGVLYSKHDDELAFQYFKMAADQRDAYALYFIALCYQDGKGVEQSDTVSQMYMTMAAEEGHPVAQYRISKLK